MDSILICSTGFLEIDSRRMPLPCLIIELRVIRPQSCPHPPNEGRDHSDKVRGGTPTDRTQGGGEGDSGGHMPSTCIYPHLKPCSCEIHFVQT